MGPLGLGVGVPKAAFWNFRGESHETWVAGVYLGSFSGASRCLLEGVPGLQGLSFQVPDAPFAMASLMRLRFWGFFLHESKIGFP